MDLSLEEYVRVICSMLDIPVYTNMVESLHVLFTLYSEFKNNQHFNHQHSGHAGPGGMMEGEAGMHFDLYSVLLRFSCKCSRMFRSISRRCCSSPFAYHLICPSVCVLTPFAPSV